MVLGQLPTIGIWDLLTMAHCADQGGRGERSSSQAPTVTKSIVTHSSKEAVSVLRLSRSAHPFLNPGLVSADLLPGPADLLPFRVCEL
jgi:hypothetical protein